MSSPSNLGTRNLSPPHGCLDATQDEGQIRKWWGQWPDANLGIAAGAESGVWVLDVDGDDGHESLNQLVKQHGPLPKTVWAKTGNNGNHYLFKHPGWRVGNSRRKKPGLDTRGDGGYIVAAPSIHPNGNHYEWVKGCAPGEIEIAAAPQWLLDIFCKQDRIEDPESRPPVGEEKENPALEARLLNRAISQARTNRARHPSAVWLGVQLHDNLIPYDNARRVMIGYQNKLREVSWNPTKIMFESEVLKILDHVYSKLPRRKPWTGRMKSLNHDDPLKQLAECRGRSISALRSLGAQAEGHEVHIPMRNAQGDITGWRRKRGDNKSFRGGKKALSKKGGHNGVICPWPLPKDDPVLVCEGEMDGAAVIDADWNAVVATPGATPGRACIEALQKMLAGRGVVLAPDPDTAGDRWRDKMGNALLRVNCQVRFIQPGEGDLDQRLARTIDKAAELRQLIDGAIPFEVPDIKLSYRPCTDLGNAERFAEQHRGRVLYDCRIGAWRIWDGRCWMRDQTGEVMRNAHKTARSIYREAEKAKDSDVANKIGRWAGKSEARERLTAMVVVAKDLDGMTLPPEQWDADPYLLNCRNGTIDLRSGKLRPPFRDDHITRMCPVNFDPDDTHPIFDRVLRQAIPDSGLRDYVQRLVGYTLVGEPSEEILVFVYGPEASGKTTVCESLRKALGDYASTTDPAMFMAKDFNNASGPTPELARLAGARLVVTSEIDDGKRLSQGLVKRITGGERIVAREMYRSPFEYLPSFTIWMVGNHRPQVNESDGAMWRRIKVLPFDQTIPKERRDPKIKKAMMTVCGPSILAWAVQGCLRWQHEGLGEPVLVEEATSEYREAMDPISDFLEDHCLLQEGLHVTVSHLREAYDQYCREIGNKYPISPRKFAEKLKARGCASDRITGGTRIWRRIGMKSDTSDTSDTNSKNFFQGTLHGRNLSEVPSLASLASLPAESEQPRTPTNPDREVIEL